MIKRKISGIIALALLLSSCAKGDTEAFPKTAPAAETVPLTETTAFVREAENAVTEPESEKITPEAAANPEPDEPKETLTLTKDGVYILDLEVLGENYGYSLQFISGGEYAYCGGDRILAAYEDPDGNDYSLIIDISNGEAVNIIEGSFYPFIRRGDLYVVNKNETDPHITEIHTDGTFWRTDYENLEDIPILCGSHVISEDDGSILDGESGEVLVPAIAHCRDKNGKLDWECKSSVRYSFVQPVDENHFIYQGWGYEWSECLGIYDFKTKTASELPGSSDAIFICAANNKICFYEDEYNGDGRSLYCTDLTTLETKKVTDFSGSGSHIAAVYAASDDGKAILARLCRYGDSGEEFYKVQEESYVLLDPDSGEIIFTLPDSFGGYELFFTENYICGYTYGKIFMYPRNYSITAIDMNDFSGGDGEFIYESGIEYCGKDIVCAAYYRDQGGWENTDSIFYVLIIDIAKQDVIGKIEREFCDGYYILKRNDGVYAALHDSHSPSKIYKINSDGSYELTAYEDISNIPGTGGSHKILNSDGKLIDEDSGEILVSGNSGDDNNIKAYFNMPVDENRFIYVKNNSETGRTYLGIYDFSDNTAVDLPADEMAPIFVRDNILYVDSLSEGTAGIYTIDLDTLETRLLYQFPYSPYLNNIFAPESKKYIGVQKRTGSTSEISVIEPETGEVVQEFILPEVMNCSAFFTDSFICGNKDNFLIKINTENISANERK